jgi:glutamine amidotransferase-like uncharacterized protein
MNSYKQYKEINRGLGNESKCFIEKNSIGIHFSNDPVLERKPTRQLRIGIYAGNGSSHSWLWFVDLFEKVGFWGLTFFDENRLKNEGLEDIDVLVISGGDTFAVAEALGERGSSVIKKFVEKGGIYMGSCAGAYLPMISSKNPLNLFNFVDVKITNLSKKLPLNVKESPKFCTPYGCDYVYHPIRDAVWIRCNESWSTAKFMAPVYGGPGMVVSDPSKILAYYDSFTDKTVFLVNKEVAEKTIINKAAIVRIPFGNGTFYLLGPHLEHPNFPEANKWVIDVMLMEAAYQYNNYQMKENYVWNFDDKRLSPIQAIEFVRGLKRELSNSRIAISGLEFSSVSWLIGKKVYEPEKIRVFLESMWKRIVMLEKFDTIYLKDEALEQIILNTKQITVLLRSIRKTLNLGFNTHDLAVSVFHLLHEVSISFYEMYFRNISANAALVN